MKDETYIMYPYETGGMLIGYKDIKGDIVICEFIGAGPNSVHLEYKFIPDGEYQQEHLTSIYYNTKGEQTYLGDWHSHPDSKAYMSKLDRKTIKKIATTKTSQESNSIFIIIGTEPKEVKCWRYHKKSKRNLQELEIRCYN